ncbi:MAG TPA: hypothetical protein ENN79_06605 [Desulfobacteraceae bacterium]|nr:hypothetical protein [Desulfobacteraceae bacterium]
MGLVSRKAVGGAASYYTFDPMGNTSEVTGPGAALQNRYAYRPFGSTLLNGETSCNPFLFMGELGVMADPAGLHHVRARHYDARPGRFTSMDPIGFLGGDVNLYRYALNSPLDGFDPTGLDSRRKCGLGQGLVNITSGTVKMVGGAYTSAALIGIPICAWGAADALWGTFQICTHYMHHGPNRARWMRRLDGGWISAVLREAGVSGKKVWWVELALLLETVTTSPFAIGLSAVGVNVYCSYNQQGVPAPSACGTRGSSSSFRTPQVFDSTRQALSISDCMPFTPLIYGEAGLAASHDPNQKLGPAGYGDRNFLPEGSIINYHIDFENLESASAPAQVVTIRDEISSYLDPSTFELTWIGFGDVLVPVPSGSRSFETVVEYPYKDDDHDFVIEVQIEAWLEDGVLHVNFLSIDPETGLPPQDVGAGFLPPENGTGRGQGFISYMIQTKADLPAGTEIRNIATVQFDFGLEIDTNQVDPQDPSQGTDPEKEALVSIDGIAPTSRVSALPEKLSPREFRVSWSGEDDEQGSGVGVYEIHVSVNGGPYTLWLRTSETSAVFTGDCGDRYTFYSLAVDNVGNVQEAPAEEVASIEVPILPGDADGSGEVNLADLILVLQGVSSTGDAYLGANVCADVDGDGRLGTVEAVYILQFLSE